MKKTIFLSIIIIVSFFTLSLSYSVLAIGQMTAPILIENVLRGQEITENLKLLNSKDKEVTYGLKAEGDIAEWISFYKVEDKDFTNPIAEIQLPPESYANAVVKIDVPEDTPNGAYSGRAVIVSIPKKDPDTGKVVASVFQRIGREILITVTDIEIVRLEATIIPLEYGVREGDSLKIKVIYDNKGNVSVRPDVQLTISKNGKTVFNAIFPYPETEEAVKPRTTKTIPLIEWQTAGYENGKYGAEIKILNNSRVVDEYNFSFDVGFEANKFLAAIALIGGGNLVLAWFIIAIFFIAAAGALIFVQKRQRVLKLKALKVNSRKNKTNSGKNSK